MMVRYENWKNQGDNQNNQNQNQNWNRNNSGQVYNGEKTYSSNKQQGRKIWYNSTKKCSGHYVENNCKC